MGKKHKKHKKQQFTRQPTAVEKELILKISIPLNLLPRFNEASSISQPELSYKIKIQKADLSAFVIPKRKEAGEDIDTSLHKPHSKKHKKKKHHHHHADRVEPIHITKSHDSQISQSNSSSSEKQHSSPHHSSVGSPLRKLSIVIPKLSSSPIPTSSPLLTYNPVQIPPVEVQPDSDSEVTKQDISSTKQLPTADHTSKAPTHQDVSPEQYSSVTNDASEELLKLKTNVKYALKNLQYQLEKKDPQGIFAEPVTDEIAPGYSALISNPMDFSTMAKKIDTLQYQSVDEYKEDFMLMCNNCMTYNPEDTVFYQAAKKLLLSGLKLIAKEAAKKTDVLTVPAVAGISSYSRSSTPLSFQTPFSKRSISPAPSSSRELLMPTTRSQSSLMCRIPLSLLHRHGIKVPASGSVTQELRSSALTNNSLVSGIIDGDIATSSLSSTAKWVADTVSAAAAAPPYDDTGMTKLRVGWISDESGEDTSDDEEYDEVLEQVQAAAASAHEAVINREAVDLAYLDTSEAGMARLNILNPDGAMDIRNLDMTELEAAIAEGEEANKKLELEHSRHKTTPVAYLMYGPYGAFAPYFDSSFATLTRMDSSLLYSVYGDDMGVTYAHSLQRFVRGTSSFACEMAEAILNGLTSNKHRLLKEKLTEQRDKLFHMSQQQQQQQQQQHQGQDDKASESDVKCPADHQMTAVTVPTADNPDATTSEADAKEKDPVVVSTTAVTSTSNTNTAVTTTTASSSTGTTTTAATIEKLPQPVLDKNVEILLKLQQLQNERLSQPPFTVPQSQETATALQVTENLKELTSKVTPGDVVSVQALQNAMGITMTTSNPVTTPHSNNA